MLPFEDEQIKQMWPTLRDEYNRADSLLDLVIALFFDPAATGTKFKGVNEVVLVTIMALLAKVCRTHRAVSHAAKNGLGEDAMTLARSMYETTMIALFILQKPNRQKQRTAMYHAWSAYQTLKMMKKWKETPGLRRQAKKKDLAKAQQLLDFWVPKCGGVDASYHWSGGRLESAVKLLREDHSYQTVYRYLSAYTHGADVAGAIEVDAQGKYVIELMPNEQHCVNAMELSRMVLWIFAARVNRQWGFGFDDRLRGVQPPNVKWI